MGKKIFFSLLLFFIASFMVTTHASAEEINYFDVEYSTDKKTYNQDDEMETTIKVTNTSEVLDANDVDLKTILPKNLEVIGDDVKVKDNEVIWDVDKLKHGKSTELTFKTKVTSDAATSESDDEDDDESDADDKVTGAGAKTDQNGENGNGTSTSDEMTAPQTGDESSILTYILILVISTIVGVVTFLIIRKKRMASMLPFILAFTLLTPVWSAQAEASDDIHSFSESHTVKIADEDYELVTTVAGSMQDYRDEIPVTGTAYGENNQVLKNETLTFSSTIHDETVTETVETDNEGYFVARILSHTSYQVTADQLDASVKALEENKIELTDKTGKIELGKSLTNIDNKTDLQPSVIYLNEKETAKISNVADDLSQITFSENVDIQADDLIVIPEWGEYTAGLSFEVTSVNKDSGQVVVQTKQPEIDDIFEAIFGEVDADLTAANFEAAPGIEVSEVPEADTFSSFRSTTEATMGSKLELILKDEDFGITGKAFIQGGVDGKINWKKGFNLKPVEELDVLFTGEQGVEVKAEKGFSGSKTIGLGNAVIPTSIPLVNVTLPADLNFSADGDVTVTIAGGAKEEFGFAYSDAEGASTYPEEHFEPYFEPLELNGNLTASVALEQSLKINATLLELAGATASAGPSVNGKTTVIANNDLFKCTEVGANFDSSLSFGIPLFKWEKEALAGSLELYNENFGDCIDSIEVDPSEMELQPEETKSFDVKGINKESEEIINNEENLSFDVSDDKVKVEVNDNKINVTASGEVSDGDEMTVDVTYEIGNEELTDTLSIKIVDDREQGKLVGQVVDALEDTAIEDAKIKVLTDGEHVTDVETKEDGRYEVDLVPGAYKLEIRSDGYITDSTNIEIEATETTTYDSKLRLVGEEYGGDGTVSGTIKDAVTNNGVAGIKIDIRKGKNNKTGEVIDSLTTDESGNYKVELPGGNYSFELSADGYITTYTNVISIGDKEMDGQDATISVDGEVGDGYRVVLTWDEHPRDLDSHITGPTDNDDRFHVYFSKMSFKDDKNDVTLDRDDTNSYGPETITVLNQIQDGTYTYAVHNYTGRNLNDDNKKDLANSGAEVKVYRGDELVATYNVPDDQEGNSWRVLEVRDGNIVPINRMETIDGWNSADYFAPEQ